MKHRVFPLWLLLAVLFPALASAEPGSARAGFTPVLGVRVVELDPRQFDELKLDFGVRVVAVTPGSAAEAAGLKEGDVIVELAGRPVVSPARLRHLVAGLQEGEKFAVVHVRDGRRMTAQAQLQSAPPGIRAPGRAPFRDFPALPFFSRARLGVLLQELTDELRAAFGVDSGTGVLVAEVTADSPAKKAGVAAGDIIVRMDRRAIRRVADVHRVLSCFDPGEELALAVIRDKKPLTLTVKLEAVPDRAREVTPPSGGREFFESLERGLREMFEGIREQAEPVPGPGV